MPTTDERDKQLVDKLLTSLVASANNMMILMIGIAINDGQG